MSAIMAKTELEKAKRAASEEEEEDAEVSSDSEDEVSLQCRVSAVVSVLSCQCCRVSAV